MSWRTTAGREAWVAAHPFLGAILLGTAFGALGWPLFAFVNHAPALTALIWSMAMGLLWWGPFMAVYIRRRERDKK